MRSTAFFCTKQTARSGKHPLRQQRVLGLLCIFQQDALRFFLPCGRQIQTQTIKAARTFFPCHCVQTAFHGNSLVRRHNCRCRQIHPCIICSLSQKRHTCRCPCAAPSLVRVISISCSRLHTETENSPFGIDRPLLTAARRSRRLKFSQTFGSLQSGCGHNESCAASFWLNSIRTVSRSTKNCMAASSFAHCLHPLPCIYRKEFFLSCHFFIG